jgi:hypothetical protein
MIIWTLMVLQYHLDFIALLLKEVGRKERITSDCGYLPL